MLFFGSLYNVITMQKYKFMLVYARTRSEKLDFLREKLHNSHKIRTFAALFEQHKIVEALIV